MASGGKNGDSSDGGLDLSELNFELKALEEAEQEEAELNKKALEETELNITNENLPWEEDKAQTEYEEIEAATTGESNPPVYIQTTTPTKDYLSKFKPIVNLNVHSTPKTPQVHTDLYSKSAPTSPLRNWSNLNIQQRIDSFENLSKAHQKQKSVVKSKTKSKASPKIKKSTRSAIKKGQVSPLVKPGAFLKKRRAKAENYL